ncbi:protein BTG1-like [Mixophyes fleayi]|uniref:protein BTG1-like n=1 Tax=Mixophyes fleayi TaxID=3061075 RepID=UPI003F4DDAD6
MRAELVAGVEFIKTLVNRFHKLDLVMVEVFGEKLAEILCHKYIGHWYPEKPMKGQAYRCIRTNMHDMDESVLEARVHSGLRYQELTLPKEVTVWIDPYEVSCRLGEEGYPFTVTKFDPKEVRNSAGSFSSEDQDKSSSGKCSNSTPEDDGLTWSSSVPSSPSVTVEDSDSGIDGRSEVGNTSPISYSPAEDAIWLDPTVEPMTRVRNKY